MRLRIALAALLAPCALAAFAGSAAAEPGRVPPGNSGAVQYTETLPGVGGDQTTSGLHEGEGAGGGKGSEQALGAADAARLEALGEEGAEAAQLAAAGAPAARSGGGGSGGEGGQGGKGASSPPGGASGLGQVLRAATGTSDSGGMGLLLPLLIAMGVLVSLAFLASRRRSTPGQPGQG